MKKLILFLFALTLSVAALFAQAPQKMSYQAVVRNTNNTLVTNQSVTARISIIQGGVYGTPVYVETHNVTTNANGLLTLEVGEGSVLNGSMSAIDWANGPFYLKSEIDPAGGSTYIIEGVQQLLSVPYALYAGAAGNVPAIGVSCTNPNVTALCDYYWRICFLDPFQGSVMANFAKEQGCTSAYVLCMLGEDYGNGLAHYFVEAFEALGQRVPLPVADEPYLN